ncbi:MAG: hypothetical protein ACYTHM_22170 [Planctomycetota bacterium]|jgi:hypothetical protein
MNFEWVTKNVKVILIVSLVIILLPVFFSVVGLAVSSDPDPFLEKPHPKYKACVKETAYMRHNHMVLLKDLLADVVREGKKAEFGFNDCWKCHTSRTKFCDRCHDAVGLDLRCFNCHYFPE